MQLESFYRRVLQKMGILAAGESAEAEDRVLIKETYDLLCAEIETRIGVRMHWTAASEVPDELALALRDLVAYQASSEFELPPLKAQQLASESDTGTDAAWAKIISFTREADKMIPVDYF